MDKSGAKRVAVNLQQLRTRLKQVLDEHKRILVTDVFFLATMQDQPEDAMQLVARVHYLEGKYGPDYSQYPDHLLKHDSVVALGLGKASEEQQLVSAIQHVLDAVYNPQDPTGIAFRGVMGLVQDLIEQGIPVAQVQEAFKAQQRPMAN